HHRVGDHSGQDRQRRPVDPGRAGQGADRVGAVRDGMRPALALHVAAQVLLGHQPGRDPVAPAEQRAVVDPVHPGVALDDLGQHQHRERATEHRVAGHAADTVLHQHAQTVAERAEQVVVDALADPGREHRVGEVVADPRVGAAEHLPELRGQVRQAPTGRHVHAVGHDRLPVGPLHAAHPMFRGRERRTDFRIRLRSVTVPTLDELAHRHSGLGAEAVAWLQRLVADWQIIADLSFADLVLWLPDRDGAGYWAGAQMRPTTGPTAYVDDVVGTYLPLGKRVLLDSALRDGRVAREGDPEWRDDVPVRVEAIPVRYDGQAIAVVARNPNRQGVRTPSRLELSYLQTAGELAQM